MREHADPLSEGGGNLLEKLGRVLDAVNPEDLNRSIDLNDSAFLELLNWEMSIVQPA
jgi:hypothetical protein